MSTWRHWPLALRVGCIGFGLVLAAVLLSLVWLPYNPQTMNIPARLLPPCWPHPFGTDEYGRDMLSNVIAGGRVSLSVAFGALFIGAVIGIPLGVIASMRHGWVDEVIARGNDIIFAFPFLIIAALIVGFIGVGAPAATLALGIFNIPVFTRVTRTAALGQWHRDYVLAAIVSGKTRPQIARQHILPNIASALLVQSAILVSLAILAEAGLAYLGIGAQPPTPSWGRMLGDAQPLIGTAPWLALFPGLAVLFTVFMLNLIADGLRDLLDPRFSQAIKQDERHEPSGT